jgi:SAM-dependent methyltransferase
MKIHEFSPNTLKGSFTDDLIISKLWLIREISKIHKKFNAIYILGSWYGNLSLFLIDKHDIEFKKIINVDINKEALDTGHELAKKFGVSDLIQSMVKDANTLNYKQAKKPSLVINTSVNDMKNEGWFDRIPEGTLVALQTRDSYLEDYPLSRVLYAGKKDLRDPETAYTRYMVIGIK